LPQDNVRHVRVVGISSGQVKWFFSFSLLFANLRLTFT
jgi:hypothetical protein